MGVHRQENGGSGREAKVEQVPVVCQIKSDNERVPRQGSLGRFLIPVIL